MYHRKFFALGLILIFMLTLSVIGLGEEVSSYEDLVTTIEKCTGTSLEIDIAADLTVPDGTDVIEVPSTLSDLVIQINGHKITGKDKCGFLTMDGGCLTVQNGTISHFSTSDPGGAIYGGDAITLKLSNMTFESNTSTYDRGGAVYAGDQSTVTVENSVFKSNKSEYDDGGALYISDGGSCSISDCQFIKNSVPENYGGGAICIRPEGTLEISRSSFTGNEADEGGAIYLYRQCTLKINTSENEQNTSFINNKAQSIGGAIEATVPKALDIRYSSFSSNSAGNDYYYGYGGAIRIEELSDPMMARITNCSFTENNADYGGAIQYDTCLFVDQSSFISNTSTYGGGAISQPMTRFLYDTDSDGNKIYDPGILKGKLIIKNSEFRSNQGGGGGAVFVYPSIDEDELNEYGKWVDFGDNITIDNSVFSENEAKEGSGGALFFENIIEASLSRVTIDHNSASKRGGGIYIRIESDPFSSRLSISTDSKIHNNTAGEAASDLFSMDGIEIASIPDAASMNVSYRDSGEAIQGWFEDSTPRYSLEHPTTAYSVEQIKTMSASGDVHLIAAPIPLSKIIYAPNGGTDTMNPTAGGVGTTVPISASLFTYPSSKFTGWNTKADGTGAVYAPGDSYTLTAEDLTLYAQWITPVNVIKIWDDANDMDGIRPKEGLSVSLAQGGHVLNISGGATDATYLLTPAESWMHTFELPAGDYSHIELWEGSADGYIKSRESKQFNEHDITIVVTNRHEPALPEEPIINEEYVNFVIRKEWIGVPDGQRPGIRFQLYQNGTPLEWPQPERMSDGRYIWKDLPKMKEGAEAVYSATEMPLDGYEISYSNPHSEVNDRALNGGMIINNKIINRKVPKTGDPVNVTLLWLLVLISFAGLLAVGTILFRMIGCRKRGKRE